MSTLNFSTGFDFSDLKPIEVGPFNLLGERYVVREASEGAAAAYSNAQSRAMKVDDGKVMGMDGMADADTLLVSLCTHRCDIEGRPLLDGKKNPLPTHLDTVNGWPRRVTKKLFDKIKEISPDLDGEDTEESLTKAQELLDERRKAFAKSKGGESGPKDSPASTPNN